MGHCIAGFVAPAAVLRARTAGLAQARVADLAQGFGFLPATAALDAELGGQPLACAEFFRLSRGLGRLGAHLSRGGGTALYLETDYDGGRGSQAVLVWRDGRIGAGPEQGRVGVIGSALAVYLAAERGPDGDAFSSLGLDRGRSNDDWLAHATAPPRGEIGGEIGGEIERLPVSGLPGRLCGDHAIAGLVARYEVLTASTGHLAQAVVARLAQGLGLLPATAELRAELGDFDAEHEDLPGLTRGLAHLAGRLSTVDSVAWIETAYHAGQGDEAAAVWFEGELLLGPWRDRFDAVGMALRWLDAEPGAAYDEFEAVGLQRFGDVAAWARQGRVEPPGP